MLSKEILGCVGRDLNKDKTLRTPITLLCISGKIPGESLHMVISCLIAKGMIRGSPSLSSLTNVPTLKDFSFPAQNLVVILTTSLRYLKRKLDPLLSQRVRIDRAKVR